MKKIRIGVIGAGWWATFAHLPAIKSHPDAELVAVQSREPAKAERIARDLGAKHACTSVEELLAFEELDAVIVASTPNVHFAQAKAALHSGRHVLLEKPMTFTADEARELVELAAKKQLQLLISCPWHFTPHGIEARRLIQAGALGEIKMISVLMTNPVDNLLRGTNTSPTHGARKFYVEPCRGSYSDPAIAGGGQIYCQVSHAAAYLTFLTGVAWDHRRRPRNFSLPSSRTSAYCQPRLSAPWAWPGACRDWVSLWIMHTLPAREFPTRASNR
jgi:predicted dehydrogenase